VRRCARATHGVTCRGFSATTMMSGRQGPIYMCYDAGLQEAELDHEVKLPPPGAVRAPAAPAPDPAALANAADALAAAERPV
jgi:acetolactate synthase I/II/III large subunit